MKKEVLEKILKSNKNLIVEGDIDSGKTTNVLFPIVDMAIDNKESLFIIDSKEEYVNKYYNKLKENNYNTIIINLRNLDKSDGWNPLEYSYNLYKNGDRDKAQEYLEKIGKAIFKVEGAKDPFWDKTASDFFIGLVLSLFEDGKENEMNFNSINNMFNGVDKKYGNSDCLTTYFKSKDELSKPYIFASATFLAPKETKGGILSIVRQKLRMYISNEKMSYFMNKTTFNFDDVANKPTAIIFIARDENKYLNDLTTMFIEQLYYILIEQKRINKFNFILDNFDAIDTCSNLVDILGSCSSRNIKMYISTRYLTELSKIYGSYMVNLCNLFIIENKDFKLLINNEETKYEKDFEKINVNDSDIEFPILQTNKIAVFNLEQYIENNIKPNLKASDIGISNIDNSKIEDLLKKIDEKIEKLEIEEKLEDSK